MNQLAARLEGERRARSTLVRFLCAVSIWRTAMTRVLPLCGASAWWVTLVCLLPGFAVAALLRGVMALTRTATWAEAVRACLGKVGAAATSLVLALLLLTEGVSSITALITLFTEGVGTRGTQLTLAALTGGVLAFALHREGLSRAAHLLRWGMAGAAVVIAACMMSDVHLDGLFPLRGDGEAAILAALKAGMSLAWPLALLLTVEPTRHGRLRSGVLPAFAAPAALLLLALTIPHELLLCQTGLADLLLLPTRYAPNALRVLFVCLVVLAFFLAIGASAQMAAESLGLLHGRVPCWLPYAVLAGMFLTQAGDVSALWAWLGRVEPWLLAPLLLLGIVCLPIAAIRRRTP